jgi:hypothetical protein
MKRTAHFELSAWEIGKLIEAHTETIGSGIPVTRQHAEKMGLYWRFLAQLTESGDADMKGNITSIAEGGASTAFGVAGGADGRLLSPITVPNSTVAAGSANLAR